MTEGTQWIYVTMDYSTFGLAVRAGEVVEAPPIARWAIGRNEREVADFYRSRGAEFVRLPD